jgi:hypothetical protein
MSCGISLDRCFSAFYVTGGIMRIVNNIFMAFLAVLWCLIDPKKATAAANEAATVEEFDRVMMKEMGGT